MTEISNVALMEKAEAIRERAYAPYSKFLVGAAILDDQGAVHIGCNVENAAYPLGACAEAGAISAMIAAGGKTIQKIAIAGGPADESTGQCPPCGGCRQKIAEFANDDTRILLKGPDAGITVHEITALLPFGFQL